MTTESVTETGTMLDAMLPVPRSCCSDLDLDRLLVHELDVEQEVKLRAHLAASPRCRALFDAAAEEQQRLAAAGRTAPSTPSTPSTPTTPTTPAEKRATAPRPRFVARLGAAGAGALVAAAALLVLIRAPDDDAPERRKGAGGALSVFVQHDGVARQARPGEIVVAGDKLRFSVQASSPTHVAVIARDGAGVVSLYWPPPVEGGGAQLARRVDATRDVALDGAIELDAVVGAESLYAFFCAEPVSTTELTMSVGRRGTGDARIDNAAPQGCTVDVFTYEKVARVDGDR